MSKRTARPAWGTSQKITDRVLATLEHFLHIEAVSGGVLIVATLLALSWVNSPYHASYETLWHTSVTLEIGSFTLGNTLHFLVNEGLMTVFFLVAGLEIRRELHEGALSDLRKAGLPLVAACGGVIAPALIYLGFNQAEALRQGWAVPIATDIAFALGVLALLGSRIPRGVRILLLALAIIDDIIAVLVIALFYSGALQFDGALMAAAAIMFVLLMQRFGIRSAWAYVLPATVLWFGLLRLGVHPTLAGVVLGLLTPVTPLREGSLFSALAGKFGSPAHTGHELPANEPDGQALVSSLKQIELAQRDLIPPAIGVQTALHPWVAFGVMPLFAFANAGVVLNGAAIDVLVPASITWGIALGLLLGKPLGILAASALFLRTGWCVLPVEVGWRGLVLVSVLAGIGFTMSIFIATLAFGAGALLESAKLAVLSASALAAIASLLLGRWLYRDHNKNHSQ